jgi:chromosomal replication initiation ATPase DnaA
MNCQPCNYHNLQPKNDAIREIKRPDSIIKSVCFYLDVPVGRLISKNRKRNLTEARHIIADLLYSDRHLNMSLKAIGQMLGGRDHTTTLNSIRYVENQCSYNPHFTQKYIDVHKMVYGHLLYYKYFDVKMKTIKRFV